MYNTIQTFVEIFVLNYTFNLVNNVTEFWYFFIQNLQLIQIYREILTSHFKKSRLNFKILSTISTKKFNKFLERLLGFLITCILIANQSETRKKLLIFQHAKFIKL